MKMFSESRNTQKLQKEVAKVERRLKLLNDRKELLRKKLSILNKQLKQAYETDYFKYLTDVLESYKFDYNPNNIVYEYCNIEQLMYLMYVKYGVRKDWEDYSGKRSVYERCYDSVDENSRMDDNDYKNFLINGLID